MFLVSVALNSRNAIWHTSASASQPSVFGYSYIRPIQADLAGFLFDLKRPKWKLITYFILLDDDRLLLQPAFITTTSTETDQ